MADPFAAALAVLHGAAGSVAAVYTPPAGLAIEIRVVRDQGSEIAGSGFRQAVVDTNEFIIRKADVTMPAPGATLAIGGEIFRLQGAPMLDAEGQSWRCGAVPA